MLSHLHDPRLKVNSVSTASHSTQSDRRLPIIAQALKMSHSVIEGLLTPIDSNGTPQKGNEGDIVEIVYIDPVSRQAEGAPCNLTTRRIKRSVI